MLRIKKHFLLTSIIALLSLMLGCTSHSKGKILSDEDVISYIVDLQSQFISFYWKDDQNHILYSLNNLKTFVETKKQSLVFAVNGGMYEANRFPVGLFIENNQLITPLNTASGKGNFYLKPNGVFYITQDNRVNIKQSSDFINENIKFATQSGPMLVINGQLHPKFIAGSTHLNIRNGVGILPDNRIIFIMSKNEVNFYDFAHYFQSLGCQNALYLDGHISRTYLPEKNWIQLDGRFGVMIGVTQPQ